MTVGKPEPLRNPEAVGLPLAPVMYHLDQVAFFLGLSKDQLIDTKIFFAGRTIGKKHPRQIRAVNIAVEEDGEPEWRVTEGELVRWLKLIGIKVFSRGRAI